MDTHPKPYYETVTVPPLAEEAWNRIKQAGFTVRSLANENHFLEVTSNLSAVKMEQLEALLAAKDQITWLELGNQDITDEMLVAIGQFSNLTRLRLEKNPITDQGIAHLDSLVHLESLNLYDTDITQDTLEKLEKFPSLKKLYLWQTEVSPEAIEELQKPP